MRLEPVYLVAPKPKPPSMPTRRALLGMGVALLAGGGIGSAFGYALGRRQRDAAADLPGEIDTPSGDPEVDELRRLAVQAPIEELMAQAGPFLVMLGQRQAMDVVAWRGVDRIAEQLLGRPDLPQRGMLVRFTKQLIDRRQAASPDYHSPWAAGLRAIK